MILASFVAAAAVLWTITIVGALAAPDFPSETYKLVIGSLALGAFAATAGTAVTAAFRFLA